MRQLSYLFIVPLFSLPQMAVAQSSFDFYGQLNFGIWNTDDGIEDETYFTDNDNSNTRFGFNWTNDMGDGNALRFNFETSIGLNGSSAVTIDDTDLDFSTSRTELRKFEFIYTTASYGTFSFGQGSTATDGSAEADLSGTSVIAYSGISDLAGSVEFRAPDGSFSGINIGDTFKSFDGSRRFRVRYDTPSFSGFVLSVSGGEEILNTDDDKEYYDLGAKYTHESGDLKYDARLGYSWVSGSDDLLKGSFAVFHTPTGLNLALSSGAQQDGGDDDYVYVKLGVQQNWIAAGTTALSIDYNDGSNYAIDGSESKSIGLAAVQTIDAHNLEIYAAWRTHEFDAPGESFEDIDVIALGARWKF
ncbi:MAG: porin [Pseudomonadota bacterium]